MRDRPYHCYKSDRLHTAYKIRTAVYEKAGRRQDNTDVLIRRSGSKCCALHVLWTKFGIEGFCEALAMEVEQFNIGATIVEPGGAGTEFRCGSAKVAKLMPEYESCHGFLNMLDASKGLAPGEPAKMAQRIIESVDKAPAPLRWCLAPQSVT